MSDVKELLGKLFNEIEWDNYQHFDEDNNPIGYWAIGEALYCKIDAILQNEIIEENTLELLTLIQEKVCPLLNALEEQLQLNQ